MKLFRRPRQPPGPTRDELLHQADRRRVDGDLDGCLQLLGLARACARTPAEYGWLTGRMNAVFMQKINQKPRGDCRE